MGIWEFPPVEQIYNLLRFHVLLQNHKYSAQRPLFFEHFVRGAGDPTSLYYLNICEQSYAKQNDKKYWEIYDNLKTKKPTC